MMQLPVNPQKVKEIQDLVSEIRPEIVQLFYLLHQANLELFEIALPSGDKFMWMNPSTIGMTPSPEHIYQLVSNIKPPDPTEPPFQYYHGKELKEELNRILDEFYPHNTALYMGMIWSKNDIVAEKVANAVVEYRKRERAHVERQLYGILQSFKRGE